MEILPDIEIIDLALYLKKEKILVIADTHIGYEEALNKQGILMPRFQFDDLMKKLEGILKQCSPDTIVINGDIKHEFGTISDQEWRDTLKLIDFLASKCKKLLLIKGNHDTIIGPIAKKREIEIVEKYEVGDILICHGDKIIDTKKKIVIIGHEHPALPLEEAVRKELFKCFLLGKFGDKKLIVMPSFNLVTEGTDIRNEKLLSPYLVDVSGFKAFVVSEKQVFDFGKLRNL